MAMKILNRVLASRIYQNITRMTYHDHVELYSRNVSVVQYKEIHEYHSITSIIHRGKTSMTNSQNTGRHLVKSNTYGYYECLIN